MKQHIINEKQCFINGWYMEDTSICDDLIKYHQNNPQKSSGITNTGSINKDFKISTDCVLEDTQLISRYIVLLQQFVDNYIKNYQYCNYYAPWSILEHINIQHYKPKEGYPGWHTERVCSDGVVGSRHLVFMTYLNDVIDGGETEFYYQKIKIKPEKGLTLIWGADWTFTHRGIPSPSQNKYIITGWFNFTK